jgi:hypothetical protein
LNLESVGAETDRRGFVPVNEKMQVLDKNGKVVSGVWCIGDANGAHPTWTLLEGQLLSHRRYSSFPTHALSLTII